MDKDKTKGKRPTQLKFEEMIDVVADSFSRDDMKNFAEWCRNGLLNTEYNYKKRDELLERWQKNFR